MIADLFAGPGGWDVGLEIARPGHDLMLGVEFDRKVVDTRTRAGLQTIWADVTELDPAGLEIDGLVASPPCQDWSTSGTRSGWGSMRGQLVTEVPRWVETLRPRWVACEQVAAVEPVWKLYAHQFAALGYWTWAGTLYGADYGLAQYRPRAILLAHRDRPVFPPRPTHHRHGSHGLPRWRGIIEELNPTPNLEALYVDRLESNGAGRLARFGPTPISPTLRVGPTVTTSAERWTICHPDRTPVRNLTLDEVIRLQGFPADYPFPENRSSAIGQIADTVPPPLAAAIFGALLDPGA